MPAPEKRNIFGHQSIAKPNMPSNERMNQMAEMVRNELDAESKMNETKSNTIAPADLEQLIFLGCIEDSKTISGFRFDLKTLTGKEQNDVWLSVSFLGNETKFFVVKVAFLARAIIAVNGRSLDTLYSGKDFRELSKEQQCLRVVESWQDTLINELYDFYSQLVERSKKAINEDALKK